MKIQLIAFGLFVNLNSAIAGCEIAKNIKLDDFNFKINSKNQLIIWTRNNQKTTGLKFRLKNQKVSKTLLSSDIIIEDLNGANCKQLSFRVEPIKLCKNASGEIESWRFITCPSEPNCLVRRSERKSEDDMNIISLTAEINSAQIWNSKICGTTKLTGDVTIEDSYLGEELPESTSKNKREI